MADRIKYGCEQSSVWLTANWWGHNRLNCDIALCPFSKNLGQYDRPRVHGCEPVGGVLVVLSSNQINIAMFVHQMGDTHISHLVDISSNIYLIWTKNTQYPIYRFASTYSRPVILSKVLLILNIVFFANILKGHCLFFKFWYWILAFFQIVT